MPRVACVRACVRACVLKSHKQRLPKYPAPRSDRAASPLDLSVIPVGHSANLLFCFFFISTRAAFFLPSFFGFPRPAFLYLYVIFRTQAEKESLEGAAAMSAS